MQHQQRSRIKNKKLIGKRQAKPQPTPTSLRNQQNQTNAFDRGKVPALK
jgi:hypothetical protein